MKTMIINKNVFKSTNSSTSMKTAKYKNINETSIFDTGASRSGTNNKNLLTQIEKCQNVIVQGAFGPPFRPSLKGKLGPLELYSSYTRHE